MSAKKNKKKKKRTGRVKAVILGLFCACIFTVLIVGGYTFYNCMKYINGDLVINLNEYKENQNQTSFIY